MRVFHTHDVKGNCIDVDYTLKHGFELLHEGQSMGFYDKFDGAIKAAAYLSHATVQHRKNAEPSLEVRQ